MGQAKTINQLRQTKGRINPFRSQSWVTMWTTKQNLSIYGGVPPQKRNCIGGARPLRPSCLESWQLLKTIPLPGNAPCIPVHYIACQPSWCRASHLHRGFMTVATAGSKSWTCCDKSHIADKHGGDTSDRCVLTSWLLPLHSHQSSCSLRRGQSCSIKKGNRNL